jgi:hypothetical protein
VAPSAFTYEEPCTGVTLDGTPLHMDMQTVNDLSITLTGCATGIHVNYEIANLIWFESYPSSVDGTGTVVLRYNGNSGSGGTADWTVTLGTDQGAVDFNVHVD